MRAEELRFQFDQPWAASTSIDMLQQPSESDVAAERHLMARGIRVVPELFPELSDLVARSSQKILGNSKAADVYVVRDTELQARCINPHRSSHPVIVLNSGLITFLSTEELSFVIGHELAHFLFRHSGRPPGDKNLTPAQRLQILAQSRAAEISADRVGLAACTSRTAAFRAITKVASGLDERFIRIDVNALLQQLRDLKDYGASPDEAGSTHPMFLLRLRALLLFELSDSWASWQNMDGRTQFTAREMDERIHRELCALSGIDFVKEGNEAVRMASLWATLVVFKTDGQVADAEQNYIREHFGKESADKAARFAEDYGLESLNEKYRSALNGLVHLPKPERHRFTSYLGSLLHGAGMQPNHPLLMDSVQLLHF